MPGARGAAAPATESGARRVLGFRVERLSGPDLLLQRASARYLVRLLGPVPAMRIGARVQLALDAPLPTPAAGGERQPVVRGSLVRVGNRPAAIGVEVRPHPGPAPTVRPTQLPPRPTRPALPPGAVLEAAAADGTRLRFRVRAAAAPGEPLGAPQARAAGNGADVPLAARVVSDGRGGRSILDFGEVRLRLLGDGPQPEPGTRLRLAFADETARPSAPSPAGALRRNGEDAPAPVRPLPGAPAAPAPRTAAPPRDLADALLRVLLPAAGSDSVAGSLASETGGPDPASRFGVQPARGENGQTAAAWLLGGPSDEPALLEADAEGRSAGGGPPDGAARRLRLDLHLSRLGRVRLELDLGAGPRRLLLRSERPLPETCRAGIADLFGAALEAAGQPGQLVFGRLAPPPPGRPWPPARGRASVWA